MHYFEVLIASSKYHGKDALTYSSSEMYEVGSVIRVPMRGAKVPAIVVRNVPKPAFDAKPVISRLLDSPIPVTSLAMIQWFMKYYPASSGVIVSQFLPSSLLVKGANQAVNTYDHKRYQYSLPPLTQDQSNALAAITDSSRQTFLVHGDTGTGKTRLYVELAKKVLKQKKNVIILTPEIGLTSQLAEMVQTQLSAMVLVVHSNLTGQERRIIWLKALQSSDPLVIVGPRSALFLPLSNIGLIVVDEAHDNAYKQDQLPRYHALRVAGKLAEINNSLLVFGTATPLVSEYSYLKAKHAPILRLRQVAVTDSMPPNIEIVDSREKQHFTKHSFLSDIMLDEISHALERKEQSLVFLNRRGTARVVLCQNCGWQALCPHCNIPLTYHGDKHLMRCHTCGFSAKAITSCPDCNSLEIVFKSIGTKAIESALRGLYPHALIKRFDTDNTKDERFEQQFQDVKAGKVDILVGTQMLVKGLDLPKLRTVGVVAADSSLYFPDYTAEEQTYQLLTQVIGRVGRGHGEGHIVIQSYNPDGRPLTAAVERDWDTFYKDQLAERRLHLFPPYCYVLKLFCTRSSQASAISASSKLIQKIQTLGLAIQISDPMPRFIEQAGGKFSWQIILKAKQRSLLVSVVQQLPANWNYDLDPLNLL